MLIDLEDILTLKQNNFKLEDFSVFLKKIVSNYKKLNIIVKYPNIIQNINLVNLEFIDTMINILSYSDICLFEKKEALAFFNMLNQLKGENTENSEEKNIFALFQKYVKTSRKNHLKIGIFLEDFQKLSLIELNNDVVSNKKEYEILLHPKINHTNQKLVDEYKKHVLVNQNYLTAMFYGGFFSQYIFSKLYYPSYLVGSEITKRTLELLRNNIEFPTDPEFYLVKIPKSKVMKDIENENLKKKEEKFVLDCVNKNTSTLRFYNPLFDDHLNSFFSSGTIRKQLKDKGFINTEGFVLYDSVYRSAMEKSPPKNHVYEDDKEKQKKLLYVIKKNNMRVILTFNNF